MSGDDDSLSLTRIEQSVCQIWAKALERDSVGPAHSFVELGGGSLEALRTILLIRREFGVPLAADAFLTLPTAADMARHVHDRLAESESPA